MSRPELLRVPPSTHGRVEVVTDLPDLEALRPEWRQLWRRCRATPFQSDAWLLPWWRHLGYGDLRVVAFRSSEHGLIALAPFHVYADSNHRRQRTLSLLGTGVSDYGDVLVEPGREAPFAATLAGVIGAMEDVQRLDFQQLKPDSPLLLLRWASQCEGNLSPQVPCPVLNVQHGSNDWVPERMRYEVELGRRRLSGCADIHFERADAENVKELFAALLALHAARWSEKGGGVLAAESVRRFHSEVVSAALADGFLRFHALRIGDAIVACHYGFIAGTRAFYYLGGFDPQWALCGVGHQIVHHAMTEAAREGATAFDFLRGQERYKYRWGARDEPTYRLEARLSV